MPEDNVEKLDQEITLHLQRIDSNLSYCFSKITKDIIPHVTQYGTVCEEIMDHASWLGTMFQQTGKVDLNFRAPVSSSATVASSTSAADQPPDTLFPLSSSRRGGDSSGEMFTEPPKRSNTLATEDELRNADITGTGRILRVPSDSTDDEDAHKSEQEHMPEAEADGSTLQRQRRKRKVSLLLQQEYGSSSSMVPSPVALPKPTSSAKDYRGMIDSSPMKDDSFPQQNHDESTKEIPKPGTVIHFSTGL